MTENAFQRRTLAGQIDYALSTFESLGLSPNPSSRWGQLRRLFFDKDGTPRGTITPADPDHEMAVEVQRDLNQLTFIFDAIPERERVKLIQKFQLILNDPILPQHAEKSSTGRDTQSELLAAAICWNAGLLPVTIEEPDVRCSCNSVTYGLAVKRLKKNPDRIRNRIKEGAKQVERSGIPGVILLDTSLVLNHNNDRIWKPMIEAEFEYLYSQALTRFIDEHHDDWQRWIRGKGVRAIILADSQMRVIPDGSWEHSAMTCSVPSLQIAVDCQTEYAEFWNSFQSGLPNH